MALYDYQCNTCGHTDEVALPIGDRNIFNGAICDICLMGNRHRVLSFSATNSKPPNVYKGNTGKRPDKNLNIWTQRPDGSVNLKQVKGKHE